MIRSTTNFKLEDPEPSDADSWHIFQNGIMPGLNLDL